jgi:CubicO group peptidase (beta-lactamase class C family)
VQITRLQAKAAYFWMAMVLASLAAAHPAQAQGVSTLAQPPKAWRFERPETPTEIRYFHEGHIYTLKDYFGHMPVTGLLIAKGDEILSESYQNGTKDSDLLPSQSMVKTIVAMLVGIAESEHAIHSVNDNASRYVPELKNSAYGKATIRDLLHMSSGITCQAEESPFGEISLRDLAANCQQDAPAGTRFRYSAADSEVLGMIVANATHTTLSQYLDEKIWREIGTESKATWARGTSGRELPYCCFNATLRDFARLGRLLADDGRWNGNQLIPRQWLLDATTVKESDAQLVPGKSTPFFGYGYQVWILPGPRRMFVLLGAYGQRIFVDPQTKLVMVQTATMKKAVDPRKDAETIALWLSLVHHYKSK